MTETVKVYWDGARKYGVATGKGEAQFFLPGHNDVPREVWANLTGDPTCSVNIHLRDGVLRVASEEVQVESNIGKLSVDGALELVNEMLDRDAMMVAREQEVGRPMGPRGEVVKAIDAVLAKFDKVEEGPKDDGKSPPTDQGSERKGPGKARGRAAV